MATAHEAAGSPAAGGPARRSRLTPQRETALYTAVIEELREAGYEAMTMDAIAARARTSKATLYRQWNGKPDLVAAALRHQRPAVCHAGADTGSLRGDLHALARHADDVAAEDTALFNALGHAAERNPDLGAALREALIEPEYEQLDAMLDRAAARGEIHPGVAARPFLPHLLLGALVTRKLLDDRVADTAYLTRWMDAVVLPALCAGRPASPLTS